MEHNDRRFAISRIRKLLIDSGNRGYDSGHQSTPLGSWRTLVKSGPSDKVPLIGNNLTTAARKKSGTNRKPAKKTGSYTVSRPEVGAPRRNYLATSVTEKEKETIDEYCARHGMSVSAFLADLALKDAQRPPNSGQEEEEITVTLKLSSRDIDKIRIFARLEEKTIEKLLQELVQPGVQKRQTATSLEMRSVRCWLSNEEHRIIKKYLAKHRLSARNYLALLALKATDQL
jgi:hypothetical protein